MNQIAVELSKFSSNPLTDLRVPALGAAIDNELGGFHFFLSSDPAVLSEAEKRLTRGFVINWLKEVLYSISVYEIDNLYWILVDLDASADELDETFSGKPAQSPYLELAMENARHIIETEAESKYRAWLIAETKRMRST